MSIPRIAIERPVTMFMISAVVVLLGGISLFRLPVDLMPDVTYPSITVRVGYGGVGPAEIEELIVRPLEQSLAAVPGLEQINSTASEGSGTVRLNFAWGTDLNEAADEVRTRVDRVRGRLPEEADPPSIQKFDSSASPIMGIGVEGDFDRVDAARDRRARPRAAPRARRRRRGRHRQRRPAPADPRRAVEGKDHGARPVGRSRHQHDPHREPERAARRGRSRATRPTCCAARASSRTSIRFETSSSQTKGGVPVYLRDIAEVKDTTEDLRSFQRINGKPGVRMQVTKQSGKNTVAIADGGPRRDRAHQPRSAGRAA